MSGMQPSQTKEVTRREASGGAHELWDVPRIAAELGLSEAAATEDIKRGVFQGARAYNGRLLVPSAEVERVFFASLSPDQFTKKPLLQPRWARRDEWYDLSIPPIRRYRGATYLSFAEAGRRLGLGYAKFYQQCKRGEFKTSRHVNHHWYVSEREVGWFSVKQSRIRRAVH